MSQINEAEERVLSSWIWKPETIDQTPLRPDHFFSPKNAVIARAIHAVRDAGKPVEPLSVALWIEKNADGIVSVLDLTGLSESGAASAATLNHWAEHILERVEKKRLANVLEGIRSAVERGNPVRDVVASAMDQLSTVHVAYGGETTLRSALRDEVRAIGSDMEALARGEDIHVGLPVGLKTDSVVAGGLPLSVVVVLAGDTGSGKSTVMQNMLDAYTSTGGKAMVFSAEDSLEMYRQRALARYTDVPLQDILRRTLSKDQFQRMLQVKPQLTAAADSVLLDEAAGLSPSEIISRYRRALNSPFNADGKMRLVCVDYLQILAGAEKDERMAIRNAMLKFQHAAKQDGVTILALSQLNREHAKRVSDPRPRRHDLYGSGSIEQFSKCIFGVYRPCLFINEPILGRHYQEGEEPPRGLDWLGYTELWVIKNVRGPMEACIRLMGNPDTGLLVPWQPRKVQVRHGDE